jgi:hypothetical protein
MIGPKLYPTDEYGRAMFEYKLKEALKLPAKLPRDFHAVRMLQGCLFYIHDEAGAKDLRPKSIRPHRVYQVCPVCQKAVPAGRMTQHRC